MGHWLDSAVAELKLGMIPTSCPSSRVTIGRDAGKSSVPSGTDVVPVTPALHLLFLLQCVWRWEKSCLMEILLRKPVSLIFSWMFAQLESWWQFRQHLLKHWECVMCSTATAPAWHGPSSHSEGCCSGWQVSNPHPTGVCLPVSLSLSHTCLVWAEGELGRRSRAAGSGGE